MLSAHRARLDWRRLILTHMSQDMLGRLGEVDLECAQDGTIIEL